MRQQKLEAEGLGRTDQARERMVSLAGREEMRSKTSEMSAAGEGSRGPKLVTWIFSVMYEVAPSARNDGCRRRLTEVRQGLEELCGRAQERYNS